MAAEKIGSLRFDDNTNLYVEQRGGGGSGVGGVNGLNAVNLVTGESTKEVIDAQNEQLAEQSDEIDQLTEDLEDANAEITRLEDANAELTEQLANVTDIEASVSITVVSNVSGITTSNIPPVCFCASGALSESAVAHPGFLSMPCFIDPIGVKNTGTFWICKAYKDANLSLQIVNMSTGNLVYTITTTGFVNNISTSYTQQHGLRVFRNLGAIDNTTSGHNIVITVTDVPVI